MANLNEVIDAAMTLKDARDLVAQVQSQLANATATVTDLQNSLAAAKATRDAAKANLKTLVSQLA